jgi:heme-degrading monooxygenase HmoA
MIVMAMQHRVNDYKAWKKVFDKFPPSAGGAVFHRVNRRVDDPNNVTVVCGWKSVEDAKAFGANPDLASKMGEAGVIGAPRIEIYEEVEVVEA